MRNFYTILLLLAIYFLPAGLQAQCGVIFSDGFESGSYSPNWTAGAGSFVHTVNTTSPYAGTYRLESSGGFSTHLTGLMHQFTTPQTPTEISFAMRCNSGTLAHGYVVCGNNAMSASNCISFAYFTTNTIRFVSSVTWTMPATVGNWYFVEMKNVNFVSHTFDIWVNGVLQYAGFPFRNLTQNSLDRIHLYNFSSGSVGNWDNISVSTPTTLAMSFATTEPLCNGDTTGAVDMTVSGGSPGYTYNWANGSTTEDISGLGAGSYFVTVTDQASCQVVDTVTVTEPAVLTATATVGDASCFGVNDGFIDVSPSGGTPGYTYLWTCLDTTQDLANLAAGTYGIEITDTNNCTYTDSFTVNQPSQIVLSDSLTEPGCNGDSTGTILINASGGTPGYTYLWNTGDTTATVTGLGAGGYLVTVTDQAGCEQIWGGNLTQPSALSVTDTLQDVGCAGDSTGHITLMPGGGTPNYTFAWSNGATSQNLSFVPAGIYSVTVTDANGCNTTLSSTVSEPPALGVTGVVTDQVGGTPGNIDLSVSGGTPGYTYNWSNGQTTQDASNLIAGNYSVTITDANGCQLVQSFTVSFIESVYTAGLRGVMVNAWPNPFAGSFQVAVESDQSRVLTLQVMTAEGKQIQSQKFEISTGQNELSVDAASMPGGVYLVRLADETGSVVIRMVKAE